MSFYQSLKPVILELLGLTRDAVHIHVGFFCLVLVLLFTQKKANSWFVLLPGFLVSLMMEFMDLWDDYHARHVLNFMASLHDLINTNLIPVVIVLLVRRKKLI